MEKVILTDKQIVNRANAAVKLAIDKAKAMDAPVKVYDSATGTIYQENSDGTRIEYGKRLRKGRYSERVSK